MKWLKRIAISIGALILLSVVLVGGFVFWIGSSAIDAPNYANAPTDTGIAAAEYAEVIEAASARLTAARAELNAPALSIAVAREGELLWVEAQGLADVESATPADHRSRFIIGSVSKPVTAALAGRLADAGLVDLDADIHAYLPDYPALPHPLTIRQLLSHQGGIRHYGLAFSPPTFSESGLNQQFDTTQEALAIFSDDELLFEPDTDFSYSTYGYTLAAAALEGATGEDFLSLLDTHVFTPLGMGDTQADYQDRAVERRVSDYLTLQFLEGLLPAPATNSSYKWAGGGLISTPRDLATFASALMEPGFLSPQLHEQMFTPRTTSDGEVNGQSYGLGWRMGGMYHPRGSDEIVMMINHGGTSIGGTAILIIQPESGFVIALTANVTPPGGSGSLRTIAAGIIRDFMDIQEGR